MWMIVSHCRQGSGKRKAVRISFLELTFVMCHRLGGLNKINLSCHTYGSKKSKIKVLIPSENWERVSKPFSLTCRWPFFLYVFLHHLPSKHVLTSLFYKDTSHIGLRPTLKPHFNLVTSVKTFSSNKVTFWILRGKGFNKGILEE